MSLSRVSYRFECSELQPNSGVGMASLDEHAGSSRRFGARVGPAPTQMIREASHPLTRFPPRADEAPVMARNSECDCT